MHRFVVCVLLLAAASPACGGPVVPANPCGDNNGIFDGSLLLDDGYFYDVDTRGSPFAAVGDGTVLECRTVTDNIIITGRSEHFDDLDNIESVYNIIVEDAQLPAQTINPESAPRICGRLGSFRSLKTIVGEVFVSNGDFSCMNLGGFESLEYVGASFDCGLNEEVGRSLKYVGGTLWCNADNLSNLEYVGELPLTGGNLPSLKHAGVLVIMDQREGASVVDLSSLESVGPIPHTDSFWDQSGLFIEASHYLVEVKLGSLEHIEGDVSVIDNGGRVTEPGAPPTLTNAVWELMDNVTVTGYREICSNGLGGLDPCPYELECEAVFGVGSLRCCKDDWPICVEKEGDE